MRCSNPLHRETLQFFRRKRKKGLHFRNRCAIISHSPNRKRAERNALSRLENARVSRFSPLFLTQFGVIRACSSAGRAFGSHPRGREFESLQVHHQAAPKKMPLRKAQKFQRLLGFFAPIFRGVTKRCQLPCQANSMDLYLYPRLFEPLFREFFGRASLFRPRQSVEF